MPPAAAPLALYAELEDMATRQGGSGPGPPAASGNGQYAEFLCVAASVLGGAILQVFLSPPTVVTASAADEPEAFGYCLELGQCPAWQRCWQLSSVLVFCFVILSIICCGTAAIARRTNISMAAAIIFFFLSFLTTAVAVLATVFLSASRATALATCALLICLLVFGGYFGREGFWRGLDEVFLAPGLFRAAAGGNAYAAKWYRRRGASTSWAGNKEHPEFFKIQKYFLAASRQGAGKGATPLHIAACCGHTEVVKELLRGKKGSASADIHARDSMGCTALHVAAAKLDHAMVELLLGRGADAWALSKDGWTPLLAAMGPSPKQPSEAPCTSADVWRLHLEGVKLDTKLDPRSKERKQTADCLLRKALHGDSRINAISPGDGLTALQLAIKRSWGSFVNSLLAAGAAVDVPGTAHTSLGLACITLSLKRNPILMGGTLVKTLLTNGAGKDYQDKCGNTALHTCINYLSYAAGARETNEFKYRHLFDCAMVLLTNGASIDIHNADGETPLMRAVAAPGQLGKAAVAMLLRFEPKLGAVDALGRSAMHHAIHAANTDAVDLLLTAGMDFKLPSQQGLTPLQQAAAAGLVDIAALLINAGADVNHFPPITDYEEALETACERLDILDFDAFGHIPPKMPPLMHAISQNKPSMVWALLTRGADVDLAGPTYPSPLFCAAQNASTDVIEILVKHGASVNQKEAGGKRPLHAAAMAANPDTVAALLAAGAKPFSRDYAGKRASRTVGWGPGRQEVQRLLADAKGRKGSEVGQASTLGGSSNRPSASPEPADADQVGPAQRRRIILRNWYKQPRLRKKRRGLPLHQNHGMDQEEEEGEEMVKEEEEEDSTTLHVHVVVQPNGGPPSPVTPVSAALAVPPATSASPVWAALQAAVRWLRSPLFRANKSTLLHPTSPQPSQTRRNLSFQ